MAFQDFYSKLSDNEKKIFYVAVGVVLLMILDRTFLGPVFSRMKLLDEKIQQQKNVIEQDLRFLSYKERIMQDNEELRSYYGDQSKTTEEIIANFLKKLEMMASQSQVNLIKVSPSDLKQGKGYAEYYANLECEGLLEDVAAFMHRIDTSDDLLKITKVNMGLKRASGEEISAGMVVSKMIIDSTVGDFALKSSLAQSAETGSFAAGVAGSPGDPKASGVGSGPDGGSGAVPGAGSGAGAGSASGAAGAQGVPSAGASGTGAQVSERVPMTGLDKMTFIPQEQPTENAPEVKPSLFEVIMQRMEKDKK